MINSEIYNWRLAESTFCKFELQIQIPASNLKFSVIFENTLISQLHKTCFKNMKKCKIVLEN